MQFAPKFMTSKTIIEAKNTSKSTHTGSNFNLVNHLVTSSAVEDLNSGIKKSTKTKAFS